MKTRLNEAAITYASLMEGQHKDGSPKAHELVDAVCVGARWLFGEAQKLSIQSSILECGNRRYVAIDELERLIND